MKTYVLGRLSEIAKMSERDLKEYSHIKKNGMDFEIHAYSFEGLGNLSTVSMKAMFGLMKMQTVVFTPLQKDAPLYSYDKISAFGNTTLISELYDTNLKKFDGSKLEGVKERAIDLPDHDLGKHWYDGMKIASISKRAKKQAEKFEALEREYFNTYLELLENSEPCNEDDKREKTAIYVDGLFKNGGPSTDQFKKMIGNEKAYELFSKFIFSSQL